MEQVLSAPRGCLRTLHEHAFFRAGIGEQFPRPTAGGGGAPVSDVRHRSAPSLASFVLPPLILHALDPQALSSRSCEEVDAEGEADPQDTRTNEKGCDPDHRFQRAPPRSCRSSHGAEFTTSATRESAARGADAWAMASEISAGTKRKALSSAPRMSQHRHRPRSRSIRNEGGRHQRQALDVLEWKHALAGELLCLPQRHPLVDLLECDVRVVGVRDPDRPVDLVVEPNFRLILGRGREPDYTAVLGARRSSPSRRDAYGRSGLSSWAAISPASPRLRTTT